MGAVIELKWPDGSLVTTEVCDGLLLWYDNNGVVDVRQTLRQASETIDQFKKASEQNKVLYEDVLKQMKKSVVTCQRQLLDAQDRIMELQAQLLEKRARQ